MSISQVIVLAGGPGKRLLPFTRRKQKAMVEVYGKPVLEWIVEELAKENFKRVVISVCYLKRQIIDYFEGGEKYGMKITYANSNIRYGTVGAVKCAFDKLDKDILVIYGDIITDLPFLEVLKTHLNKKPWATVALTPIDDVNRVLGRYGIAIVSETTVKNFIEKPKIKSQVISNLVNMGVFVIKKDYLENAQMHEDFSEHIFPRLLQEEKEVYAFFHRGYWRDIGHVDELEAARREYEAGIRPHSMLGDIMGRGISTDEGNSGGQVLKPMREGQNSMPSELRSSGRQEHDPCRNRKEV